MKGKEGLRKMLEELVLQVDRQRREGRDIAHPCAEEELEEGE